MALLLPEVKYLRLEYGLSQQLDGTHPQVGAGLSRRGHWEPSVCQPSVCRSVSSRAAKAGEEAGRGGFDWDWSWEAEAQGKVQRRVDVELVFGKVILDPPHPAKSRTLWEVLPKFPAHFGPPTIAGGCPEKRQQTCNLSGQQLGTTAV